jgi:hypothetical protein
VLAQEDGDVFFGEAHLVQLFGHGGQHVAGISAGLLGFQSGSL